MINKHMRARDFLTEGFYNVEGDNYYAASIDDSRRPRFTLEHLNTLRKIRAFREYEKINRQDIITKVYAQPTEESGL
mgnify:FL=1|jgi:predicted aminopeptidase|tara:strand:+ start:719 stop:949 length:231 start_codon:yes stop_codon:yes gene_type:complete